MSLREAFAMVMNFFLSTTTFLKEKISIIIAENRSRPHGNGALLDGHGQMMVLFGVCLAGVSATLQALQSTKPLDAGAQLVILSLLISLISILVSIYIRPNHHQASEVVMHISVFFGTAALTLALVMNLSTRWRIVAVAVCFTGLLSIAIFKAMFKPT